MGDYPGGWVQGNLKRVPKGKKEAVRGADVASEAAVGLMWANKPRTVCEMGPLLPPCPFPTEALPLI